MMIYMKVRVRSFLCLLFFLCSIAGNAAAAVSDFVARRTWKQKTALVGLTGSVLLNIFNKMYHKDRAKKERAKEATLYGSDEAFKKASEKVAKSRKSYFALTAIKILMLTGGLVAGISSLKDIIRDEKENFLLSDEQRLRAGPEDDANNDDNGNNSNENIHEARQRQLLGIKRWDSYFEPWYVRLNRPTPTKEGLSLMGHKDHRTMILYDAEVATPAAWDVEYLKNMGPLLAGWQRLEALLVYHEQLETRIRRFKFIFTHYDELNTKLLRGGLSFDAQKDKTDEQVRDTLKPLVEEELRLMEEELKALNKALER